MPADHYFTFAVREIFHEILFFAISQPLFDNDNFAGGFVPESPPAQVAVRLSFAEIGCRRSVFSEWPLRALRPAGTTLFGRESGLDRCLDPFFAFRLFHAVRVEGHNILLNLLFRLPSLHIFRNYFQLTLLGL